MIMVTTLKPSTKKTNFRYVKIGYTRVSIPEYHPSTLANNLDKVAVGAASPESPKQVNYSDPKGKGSFFTRITRPLASVYDLVAGPPMTERDRNRQAIRQTYGMNSAALNWFQRTTW